jgi:hypothetical protein
MKWHAALAGALASAILSFLVSSVAAPSVAFAEMRIVGDPGGEVSSYIRKFQAVRNSGERVVIDGPCLSACTLLLGLIPKSRICVTHQAALGFHAASYYDDVSRELVPTRAGSRFVMRIYPAEIRGWIQRHGGLTPKLIMLRGRELAELYNTCQ